MQRLPARTTAITNRSTGSNSASPAGLRSEPQIHGSPFRQLAVKIREEQGVERLKEYLTAMKPFAAPNELKKLCEDFGFSYERLNDPAERKSERAASSNDAANNNDSIVFGRQSIDRNERFSAGAQLQPGKQPAAQQAMPAQLQMLQKLMYLQGLLGGGNTDPAGIINAISKLH